MCCFFLGFFSQSVFAVSENFPIKELGKLSSEKFAVRTEGYNALKKWANENSKIAPEELHRHWKKSEDPEIKARCYDLMKKAVIARKFGRVQGFVGIEMPGTFVSPDPKKNKDMAIPIVRVRAGSAGEKAGLKVNDKILGIDDLDFKKLTLRQKRNDLRMLFQVYIRSKHAGDTITLHVLRDKKQLNLKVVLMELPAAYRTQPRVPKKEFFEEWLKGLEKS